MKTYNGGVQQPTNREASSRGPTTVKSWDSMDGVSQCLVARVLCHPELARVGDFAVLQDAEQAGTVEISRTGPMFRTRDGRARGPLESAFVSRLPLVIERHGEGDVTLRADARLAARTLVGNLEDALPLPSEALSQGQVVALGRSVVLWIGEAPAEGSDERLSSLIGEGAASVRLRRQLVALLGSKKPVLLKGEVGVGRSAIARIVHNTTRGETAPFVVVPMLTADAEALVGRAFASEGVLGGAFAAARGGTLFLDSLETTPRSRRSAVERVLSQVRLAMRGMTDNHDAVRVIASCSSSKDQSAVERMLADFHEVEVPALSERREDIPLLFAHFARRHLETLRAGADRASREEVPLQIPADLVLDLLRRNWDGNITQLRRVAEQVAFDFHTSGKVTLPSDPMSSSRRTVAASTRPPERPPALTLTDQEILEALQNNDFAVARTAQLLGVSKAWLHQKLANSDLPRGADLEATAIVAALAAESGNLRAAAKRLQVSKHALSLRMSTLGINRP